MGKNIRITIFGRSHEEFIGITAEGFPKGFKVNMDELAEFMSRRSPGQTGTSQRKESDKPVFKSGITDGILDGKPLTALIYNEDAQSKDYVNLNGIPRPGHADYPVYIKYNGEEDMRGGGKYSGRMTAPYCIAGGIAKQILSSKGINIKCIMSTKNESEDGDSIGGIVSCKVEGMPIGVGDCLFDGLDGLIAYYVFAIPAVKGIEFGTGFKAAYLKGSENNDEYYIEDGKVKCRTNNAGGILGGMSNGMPITLNVAFKPTPSISKMQNTVNLNTMKNTQIEISGRHDPCVALRALPVVEAAVALAILDSMSNPDINGYRTQIDVIDRDIARLLKSRFEITDKIGLYKRENNIPVHDAEREKDVLCNVHNFGGNGIEKELTKIYDDIFEMSRNRQ